MVLGGADFSSIEASIEVGRAVLENSKRLVALCFFALLLWSVYLLAFHGTLILFAFEEIKKYNRRWDHVLEILGRQPSGRCFIPKAIDTTAILSLLGFAITPPRGRRTVYT